MAENNIPIDMARRWRRPASKPVEYYQRPHCYPVVLPAFAITGKPTCLALNRQRTPAITLFVQADLANLDIVNVGDANTNLLNGIQLDPGKAVLFSTADQRVPGGMGGGLFPTPMEYSEAMEYQRNMAMGPSFGIEPDIEIMLDIADFFGASAAVGCRLRLFWTKTTRV